MAAELTIGALSKATGVPADTLRTWERRYGFPRPIEREGSSHRRYPIETVEHIRLIVQAMHSGHKASVALHASLGELRRLLALEAVPERDSPPGRSAADYVGRLFMATRLFDASALQRGLQSAWQAAGHASR